MRSSITFLYPHFIGAQYVNTFGMWLQRQKSCLGAFVDMLQGDYSNAADAAPYYYHASKSGYRVKTLIGAVDFTKMEDQKRNEFLLRLNSHPAYKESVEQSLGKKPKKPHNIKATAQFLSSGFDWGQFRIHNKNRLTRTADLSLALSAVALEAMIRNERYPIDGALLNGLVLSLTTGVQKMDVARFSSQNRLVIPNSGSYIYGSATKIFLAYDCEDKLGEEEKRLIGIHIWGDAMVSILDVPEEIPDSILIDTVHDYVESQKGKVNAAFMKQAVDKKPAVEAYLNDYFRIRSVHE